MKINKFLQLERRKKSIEKKEFLWEWLENEIRESLVLRVNPKVSLCQVQFLHSKKNVRVKFFLHHDQNQLNQEFAIIWSTINFFLNLKNQKITQLNPKPLQSLSQLNYNT